MKKTTILITALIMLFVGAPQAKAVPMYYTFEGTVTGLGDNAGIISDQFGSAFGVNDIVTYTFILDFDADGTYTDYDGVGGTSTATFPDNPPNVDYFYDAAYSGDYLVEVDGGIYNADGDTAEYNYGYDYFDSGGTSGALYVNSDDDLMKIHYSAVSLNFFNMPVGTYLTGTDYAYNANNALSYIFSSLTLIYKSETPPPVSVPEPSTLLLLGSGLLALGMFRRVRQEG